MTEFKHIPVMLEECLEALNLKDGGVYFDGTLGGAGHSSEILKRTSPNGYLYATDLDDYAISRANEKLSPFNGRYTIIKSNFKEFENIKSEYNVSGFDGILLDLGVSSFQLDDRERGFSYLKDDVRIDMRMNRQSPLSAYEVINNYSEKQLKDILWLYGEEKFSHNIAKNIVLRRAKKPIETVGDLNTVIVDSIPKKFQNAGHPAKKTFQAIRIEVNGELSGLYDTIVAMARGLKKGGRIAIITFHSLEDRIVKQAFKFLEQDCICDKNLPVCVCGKKKEIEILTKHPILASDEELEINSRSKSAKLRIAERV